MYLWSGKPVGHLYHTLQVFRSATGWFTNGWLYDRSNHPALFTGAAHGGPLNPGCAGEAGQGGRASQQSKAAKQVAEGLLDQ